MGRGEGKLGVGRVWTLGHLGNNLVDNWLLMGPWRFLHSCRGAIRARPHGLDHTRISEEEQVGVQPPSPAPWGHLRKGLAHRPGTGLQSVCCPESALYAASPESPHQVLVLVVVARGLGDR